MLYSTTKTEIKEVETQVEFEFPSYHWWHGKRNFRIVRYEMAYYQPANWNKHQHVPRYIKATYVTFGKDDRHGITTEEFLCEEGKIPQSFFDKHRNDYDDPATEVEFDECWEKAVKNINSLG